MKKKSIINKSVVRRLQGKRFTLIELLVTFAIFAILCSLLMSSLRSIQSRSTDLMCYQNLSQIGKATMISLDDRDGFFPASYGINPSISKTLNVTWYLWSRFPLNDVLGYEMSNQDWRFKSGVTIFECPKYDNAKEGFVVDYTLNGMVFHNARLRNFPVHISELRNPSNTILFSDRNRSFLHSLTFYTSRYLNTASRNLSEIHDGFSQSVWADGHVSEVLKDALDDSEILPGN